MPSALEPAPWPRRGACGPALSALAFSGDPGLDPILLGSVGDITFGSQTASGLGVPHLFAGSPSSVEPNPPDGIDFALIDPNTCTTSGCPTNSLGLDTSLDGLRAYLQSEFTAALPYTGGTPDNIDAS
jgi:hypothetical protein